MLDLESAIKHCEEVAHEQDMKADFETDNQTYIMSEMERKRCRECADEHWQLAEWLRELKACKESDWIPCSEPPKNEGTYLVYAPGYMGGSSSSKENHNGVMFSNYKNGKWSIEHGYYKRPNCVKAWRPLPEPYLGDKDDFDNKRFDS